MLATAKHYAGDGDTEYGTASGDYKIDQGITVTSHQEFWDNALRQYVPGRPEARRRDRHAVVLERRLDRRRRRNPLKMHAHKELITDVLKGKLGFKGFVISDWEGIHQIPGDLPPRCAPASTPASTCSWSRTSAYTTFIPALIAEVKAGNVPQSRIDDAVRRILRAKFEAGLFEHPFVDRRKIGQIGSQQHRASRARRSPSRRCCSRTSTARCRSPSATTSTSPAATPTTSATRPAAGRSPGRATPRTRSRARRSSTGSSAARAAT